MSGQITGMTDVLSSMWYDRHENQTSCMSMAYMTMQTTTTGLDNGPAAGLPFWYCARGSDSQAMRTKRGKAIPIRASLSRKGKNSCGTIQRLPKPATTLAFCTHIGFNCMCET